MHDPLTEAPARVPRGSRLASSLLRGAPAAGPVLGILLLTDVLRVLLPSLITLFGRAGDTPPEQMGLFATLWFVLPVAAVPIARVAGPRRLLAGAAVLLVAARLALQATDGGAPQLYVAGAGVAFGIAFLYGCAITVARERVPAMLAGGLAASAIVHLLLGQMDLVWRDGPLPWLGVLALCATFLWALRVATGVEDDLASPGVWLAFGPAMVLWGMYLATTGLADPRGAQGPAPYVAVVTALMVVAQLGMVSLAWRPPARRWIPVALLPLSAAAMIVWPSAIPAAVTALALGACLGLAGLPRASSPRRAGLGALGGMLLFLVAVFLYYAAYDADLGFPNGVVPGALAVVVAVVAVRGARVAVRGARVPVRRPPGRGAARLALAVAVVTAAVSWRPLPPVRTVTGNEFTLIAYNIRMGFGLKGTLDLDRIAAWARTRRPDVVLLSEVDRGWLLNGGHDELARVAKGLGMRYYFAPAADALWGDALLTSLPVKRVESFPLGRHDHPTGAQAQAAVISVGGTEVGILNTHLQAPPGQAPEVAALARDLAEGRVPAEPRPVVLAGDLNTTPDDPEMRVLEGAGLSDPLIALGDPPTSPADHPAKRIDHVLVSRGLQVVTAEVPTVPFSDHLPVVVRLRLTTL
ncbi:metal-dependent hydrolase [Sphaerisporangium album]|uniref:Metal-dependent hydrolase n=1 Tax=Sphaerisporangium album TaxID=509200 RepID=A0A367FS79_9ACTN|nr:endonuclease/exonuclease/phosphatase family protein [Sphaerisporangium album]RCG32547.1 metal-dependent hydrolase [Sphaerisporangium album]